MSDLLDILNSEQRLAVEHVEGPALVLAGAGSGKTRVITFRIASLIHNGHARPEEILAVTFTNKAAQEMRERVHRLLGPNRPSNPLISTFHSLCVRLLRREIHLLGYRQDFSIYDTDDQRRIMKQIIKDGNLQDEDLTPQSVLSKISFAKNHNVGVEAYALRFPSPYAEEIQELYRVYERRLRQANSLDFDDLLLKSVEVLDKNPVRRDYYSDRFRFVLVDEYQDTNRPQYALLRLLSARHNNVFVVGDEDQSIYKFRGADIRNILNFEKDYPGTRVIKLEQNYRSTQNILSVAGAVVERNTARKGKTLWTENHTGDVITCRRSPSARTEAAWVAERILEILTERADYRLAILYRANFLSRNFEDVLLEKEIPYAVVGAVGFFSRMEVKDMLAYLRIIFNPEDDVALLRIINTPPRGIGSSTIETLTQMALERQVPILQVLRERASEGPGRTTRPLARFIELFDRWSSRRDTATINDLLGDILSSTQYQAMLEKQGTREEALNRVGNIEELIRAATESQGRGETVFEFLDRASLSSELDRYDPNARVTLMTLHSAKGLEFDVVFLAGMEEGLFPHSQSLGSTEDLEEERRLCYVGITRARRKLYLLWTPFRRSFGPDANTASKHSRFLEEMPADLIEGFDLDDTAYIMERKESYSRESGSWERLMPRPRLRENPKPEPQFQPKTLAELRSYVKEQQSKSASSSSTRPNSHLKSGMRVRHAQFGDGIILNREKVGDDIKLTVTFSRVGKKTLIEKYAKLESL